jgi:hypothetical protein
MLSQNFVDSSLPAKKASEEIISVHPAFRHQQFLRCDVRVRRVDDRRPRRDVFLVRDVQNWNVVVLEDVFVA